MLSIVTILPCTFGFPPDFMFIESVVEPAQKTGLHRRSLSTGRPIPAKLSRPKENGEVATPKSPKQPKGKESTTGDNASFLIDKMFASDTKSLAKGRRTPRSLKADKPTASEHSTHPEAKMHESSVSKTQSAKVGRKPIIMRKDSSKAVPQSKKSPPEKKGKVIPSSPALVDNTDNVSETGTYTIDGELPSKEEESARKDIETVFGIKDTQSTVSDSVEGLSTDRKPSSEDLILENLEDEEDSRSLERKRSRGPEGSSLEMEVGSSEVTDLRITEDEQVNA